MAADAFGVVGVHPGMMVEHGPESIAIELLQIRDDFDQHVFHALIVQRQRQVMMIDDVVALFRPEDDGDHMLPEEFGLLVRGVLAPLLALFLHLPHADGDLRRPQTLDRNGFEDGLADDNHARLLPDRACAWRKAKRQSLGRPVV